MCCSPTPVYAHTLNDSSEENWESLYGENGHVEKTLDCILTFDNPFHHDVREQTKLLLKVLAMYHDMGKASTDFQKYLRGKCSGADHKTAAAKWIRKQWPKCVGKLLSLAFYGHHGSLVSGASFSETESFLSSLSNEIMGAMPEAMRSLPEEPQFLLCGRNAKKRDEVAFALMLSVRMLHSCLIDADWLATESFMSPEEAATRRRNTYKGMTEMSALLEAYLHEKESRASGVINALRKEVHGACYSAASQNEGVYRLSVPTGGGKTLASLSFALQHANSHSKKRIFYVIPFTSIIEQTAAQFRAVFGTDSVVEHHSNIAEDNDTDSNKFATENWDAPLIVTTTVQFFETLFSNKNKKCRKIHNIANSIIILDEAQTLPAAYLKPCLYALKTLQRDFGCTIVLCTATQPAVYNHHDFNIGWEKEDIHSLIGESLEMKLIKEMKRVTITPLGSLSESDLLEHFSAQSEKSALFIVNLTRQAQSLVEQLKRLNVEGVFHLSARMCPAHRLEVLSVVKERLSKGIPTVLVATRVVEAGVDISFPVVYRDSCGLDSLAQSAGRCNRHGELPIGKVFYYAAAESSVPSSFVDLRDGIYAMTDVMEMMPENDPLNPEIVDAYFRLFYNKRKSSCKNWDKKEVVCDSFDADVWDFEQISHDFRLIEEDRISVVVPYREEVELLRSSLLEWDSVGVMPNRKTYRKLASYSVSVYSSEWKMLKQHCELVHKNAGIWMLDRDVLYDEDCGLLRSENVVLDYVF